MKKPWNFILIAVVIMAVTTMVIRVVLLFGVVTTKPIPKCNTSWPQSHSDLVIQPCPTPMLK